MPRVGLLGWPVAHSVSPAMHNAAFRALGMDGWTYDPLPVRPGELGGRIRGLVENGYAGFNVTVPHKRAVLTLPLVRRVMPEAGAIGAANTLIVQRDGMLAAANTDAPGFLADLRAQGIDPAGMRCLVLGTGGAARAVAYALRKSGVRGITFVSRAPAERTGAIGYDALDGIAADLVVNCTPVGMHPGVDASPWPPDAPWPRGASLVDLVYNPPVTRLMQQARAAGAWATGGLGMLVRQGALSFEMWTGQQPPLDVMAEAARAALEGHSPPTE
jgi:shikimate dehydrogenase